MKQRYSDYKSSGVEWIGEIPKHWDSIRLGLIGVFSSSGIDKKIIDGEPLVKMVNYTDIIKSRTHNPIIKGDIDFMVVSTPDSKRIEHSVRKGDLVFIPSSETDEDLGVSSLIDFEDEVVYSYHILRFQFNREVSHYFKKYLGNHYGVLKQFSLEGKGTTRQIIGRNVFRNVVVVLPPIPEQEQIVKYLEEKTSQIDSLISITEKKIELLKQKRTSLINHVVTKGLDSNIEMKDSGVEWIGKIPKHWGLERLKYLSSVRMSSVDKHIYDYEKQVTICHYTDVYYNEFIDENTLLKTGSCSEEEFIKFQIRRNDVLMTKDSESPDDIGIPCLVKSDLENVVCGYHLTILKPKEKLLGGYLFRQLTTKRVRSFFEVESNGITRFGLGKSSIEDTLIILPPLNEQEQIVEYIDTHTTEIDKLISIEQRRIETLKEYRQSLISEVVTGKVRVCQESSILMD
jgi:type I restriction enzyme S subunit